MSNTHGASLTLGEAHLGASARVTIHLDGPAAQIRIRDTRQLGRAQARFAGRQWAAKHYWAEGVGEDRVTIYEFDEALPGGEIELTVPLE